MAIIAIHLATLAALLKIIVPAVLKVGWAVVELLIAWGPPHCW